METVIKIYAKTAVNLQTKMGALCFYLIRGAERYHEERPFKNNCATLAQADCMAYVAALHCFVGSKAVDVATEIHVITDSGVVVSLLDVYKAQKHCIEVVDFWREKVQPFLPKGAKVIYKKVSSKIKAADFDSTYLSKCQVIARGRLHKMEEILK